MDSLVKGFGRVGRKALITFRLLMLGAICAYPKCKVVWGLKNSMILIQLYWPKWGGKLQVKRLVFAWMFCKGSIWKEAPILDIFQCSMIQLYSMKLLVSTMLWSEVLILGWRMASQLIPRLTLGSFGNLTRLLIEARHQYWEI